MNRASYRDTWREMRQAAREAAHTGRAVFYHHRDAWTLTAYGERAAPYRYACTFRHSTTGRGEDNPNMPGIMAGLMSRDRRSNNKGARRNLVHLSRQHPPVRLP